MKAYLVISTLAVSVAVGAATNDLYVGTTWTPDASHFHSVQAAIDAIPAKDAANVYVLHLADGTYREKVKISDKANVRIVGNEKHPDRVVVSWNDTPYWMHYADGTDSATSAWNPDAGAYTGAYDKVTAGGCTALIANKEGTGQWNSAGGGTSGSYTFGLYGASDNFEMIGVTVVNTATDEYLAATDGATESGQSVAITLYQGNHATPPTFRKCRIIAYQDTLCTYGHAYFEDCFIQGEVDYIFGGNVCLFNRCTLHAVGGCITAGAHSAATRIGYMFYKCRVTVAEGKTCTLGRIWYDGHNVWWVDCHIGSGVRVGLWQEGGKMGQTVMRDYGTRSETEFNVRNRPGEAGYGIIVRGTMDDFWRDFHALGFESIADLWQFEADAKINGWRPLIHPAVEIRE